MQGNKRSKRNPGSDFGSLFEVIGGTPDQNERIKKALEKKLTEPEGKAAKKKGRN